MRSRGIAVVVCFLACLGPIPGGAGTRDPDLAQLAAPAPDSPPEVAGPRTHLGTVLETMDAGRYTYVRVDTGDGAIWAAGPHTRVGVGDTVFLPAGMAVANFESSTLLRRFDLLYLVSFIEVRRSAAPEPAAETPAPEPGASDGAPVERVAGGATVAEILEGRVELAGQVVTLRGRVVKVSSAILGRNWVHLEDGSVGPEGKRELVVTTSESTAVGDTVVVRGTVAIDRDFGHGYRYEVLLEADEIQVE